MSEESGRSPLEHVRFRGPPPWPVWDPIGMEYALEGAEENFIRGPVMAPQIH
jgi:hypothetical protein